jgi:transcriptional regulator with XRE-family HTH domain
VAATPETPQAIFAANVVRLRDRRGMTQEQLGWAAGLHQTAIARIENGERLPSLGTILKVARGLEVPPAELFAGID